MQPPPTIDGAQVLYWAYSEQMPYYEMPITDSKETIPIFGLAICTYDQKQLYRFLCSKKWEVENDSIFSSIEEAKSISLNMTITRTIIWKQYVNS